MKQPDVLAALNNAIHQYVTNNPSRESDILADALERGSLYCVDVIIEETDYALRHIAEEMDIEDPESIREAVERCNQAIKSERTVLNSVCSARSTHANTINRILRRD